MAFSRKHFVWIFAVLVLVLASNGCSRGNKKKGGSTADNVLAEDILNPPMVADIGDEAFIGMDGERGMLGELMGSELMPVYFSYDSSSLAPSELSKVQMAAQFLNSNPRATMVVEGHGDERGSREYNLALGERRALSVRRYIVEFGVSADRVQTRSYGEEQPAAFGHDESAWAQNRRVEFVVYQ